MTYKFLRAVSKYSITTTVNRIVTGIQPTGDLTIGNYLGSIDNFLHIQRQYPTS
jgi:tryptophanyl-tRNA synthetase